MAKDRKGRHEAVVRIQMEPRVGQKATNVETSAALIERPTAPG